MIQSEPVIARGGRDDAVVWALTNSNALISATGITRCVMICKRDGEDSVTIDSNTADGFDLNYETIVRGRAATAIRWQPGVAVDGLFIVGGLWKASVYLYDAQSTNGVYFGDCILDVTVSEDIVRVQVQYAPGSKDAFSPATATTINLTINNASVDPIADVLPGAVLFLSVSMTTSTLSGIVSPTTITVGGLPMDFEYISCNANSGGTRIAHQILAMLRVPDGGFPTNDVVISWPSIVVSGTTVRASANVMYNVHPDSDNFGSGFITAINGAETANLAVNALGAIFVANIQRTTGDVDAIVKSDNDLVNYTMQTPDVSIDASSFYMTGYQLFAAGKAEVMRSHTSVSVSGFRPLIAVMLEGAEA